jgi:serine/threonine protein kinase
MYDRHLSAEFRSEIQTLSKVEHLTLVKFLGHLEHEEERLILLEYVSNGTLREHLDGRSNLLEINIVKICTNRKPTQAVELDEIKHILVNIFGIQLAKYRLVLFFRNYTCSTRSSLGSTCVL